jgi:hypothetical protein
LRLALLADSRVTPFALGLPRRSDERGEMDANAANLDHVKDLLSEKVLSGLRAFEAGAEDTEESVDLLGDVSAIVQTFANAGLLEFIYLPLGSEDGYVSPSGIDQSDRYARFSIERAFIDEEAQDVVTLSGEIVETSDPEPVLEIQERSE